MATLRIVDFELPSGATFNQMKSILQEFGEVEAMSVIDNTCFVTFKDRKDATKAMFGLSQKSHTQRWWKMYGNNNIQSNV